jgi:hypothetical protein
MQHRNKRDGVSLDQLTGHERENALTELQP